MTFMFTAIDIAGIFFEIYIVITFYNLFFSHQKIAVNKKMIFFCIYFLVLFFGVSIPFLKPFIPFIAYSSTFLLACVYKPKSSILMKFTYSALIFSMLLTSEIIVGLILTAVLKVSIETTQINVFYYFIAVIMSKFILYIILKVISMFLKNKDSSLRMKKITPIAVLPMSSAYIICLLFVTSYNIGSRLITALTIIGAILLLLANIFVIYFIEKILDLEITKQRLIFAEAQLVKQTDYYNEIIDNQIKIAKIHHDMRNSYISILGYFNTNDYTQAKDKIQFFLNDISQPKQPISCSNACVGALLTVKNERAISEDIKFDIGLKLPLEVLIDDIDLCIIIGNAIDNAIEACQKIDNVNQRYILFQISDKDEYISMYIENSVSDNSELVFEKEDKILHGYGILNIKSLCEKYSGNVIFEKTEKCFKTFILLKNFKI